MDTITCILIDDEKQTRQLLKALLEDFCDGVKVLAEASNIKEGVELIKKLNPNLIFLDIEMPKESGFSLYKYFDNIDFEVIFTTAYGQYAVKAIRMAALDYLMKPINLDELMEALNRFREKRSDTALREQQHEILNSSIYDIDEQRIALPCTDGFIFVYINQIIRCEAEKSYTLFVLKDGSEIWTSKNIGEYTTILDEFGFLRIHRSHLINIKHIKRFIRAKSPTLIMEDNTEIPVASRKKDELIKILNL